MPASLAQRICGLGESDIERHESCRPGARSRSSSGLGHERILADAGVIETALRFLDGAGESERVISIYALLPDVA